MAGLAVRPLLGRHTTAYTIQGLLEAQDGTLTPSGSAVSLWAQRRGNTVANNVERSEINGASSVRQNEVILSDGESMTIDVFGVNGGTDPVPLDTFRRSFNYFFVTWVVGTGSSQRTHGGYYVRGNFTMANEGRGEVIATLELGPCDVGGPQSTVTA